MFDFETLQEVCEYEQKAESFKINLRYLLKLVRDEKTETHKQPFDRKVKVPIER